jgi:hypothetical protein
LRIDSFIGTVATGSLVAAFITFVTNDIDITNVKPAESFSMIGQSDIGGVVLPVIFVSVVAAVPRYVLACTASGRRIYAVGFNPDAARLAGIAVDRLRFLALMCSSFIAGIDAQLRVDDRRSGVPSSGVRCGLPRRQSPSGTLLALTGAERRRLIGGRDPFRALRERRKAAISSEEVEHSRLDKRVSGLCLADDQ